MFSVFLALAAATQVSTIGPWTIFRLNENECGMASFDQSTTAFVVSFDRRQPKIGFLGVGNKGWATLQSGSAPPLDFIFNGQTVATAGRNTAKIGSVSLAVATVPSWRLDEAIRNRASLGARYKDTILTIHYGEPSAISAYEAARACVGFGNDPLAN